MTILLKLRHSFIQAGATRILLTFLFVLAIILSMTQTLDTKSKMHIDKAFNRAFITFGISKALNGVISVAQGTEVAIQPAGIGINLTPGQILDPVNDLIERFSWVMLASTTSLGIQKTFLLMSKWPPFNYFINSFFILSLALLFIKIKQMRNIKTFILRFSLLLLVLRFTVPVAGMCNELVYQAFLKNDYDTSSRQLEFTTEKIDQLNQDEQMKQPDVKKKSVWESAKEFYNTTANMLDISDRIEKYKKAATETTQHVISLIVVFAFQTIIIPFLFIYILYLLSKYIVRLRFDSLGS